MIDLVVNISYIYVLQIFAGHCLSPGRLYHSLLRRLVCPLSFFSLLHDRRCRQSFFPSWVSGFFLPAPHVPWAPLQPSGILPIDLLFVGLRNSPYVVFPIPPLLAVSELLLQYLGGGSGQVLSPREREALPLPRLAVAT